jgi:hypothetical protein
MKCWKDYLDDIWFATLTILFFGVPLVIGYGVWLVLDPSGFWQGAVCMVLAFMFAMFTFGAEILIIKIFG